MTKALLTIEGGNEINVWGLDNRLLWSHTVVAPYSRLRKALLFKEAGFINYFLLITYYGELFLIDELHNTCKLRRTTPPNFSTFDICYAKKYLAMGYYTGDVHIYDLTTFKQILSLELHKFSVADVQFALDSEHIVSVADDVLIYRVNLANPKIQQCYEGHNTSITAIDAKNYRTIASAENTPGGSLKLWDTATAAEICNIAHEGFINTLTYDELTETVFVGDTKGRVYEYSQFKSMPTNTIYVTEKEIENIHLLNEADKVLITCDDCIFEYDRKKRAVVNAMATHRTIDYSCVIDFIPSTTKRRNDGIVDGLNRMLLT